MAESCTHSVQSIPGCEKLFVLEIDWQAAGDGSFTEQVVEDRIDGRIICVDTNPGATAPQANYNISLKNDDGIDVFEGYLDNRHTSNSERAYILVGVTEKVPFFPPVWGCLTLDILNNNVADALGRIRIYFLRD
jgi:hypothetical protein